jgi:hypothetical protein
MKQKDIDIMLEWMADELEHGSRIKASKIYKAYINMMNKKGA